jgi:hypothetical protein
VIFAFALHAGLLGWPLSRRATEAGHRGRAHRADSWRYVLLGLVDTPLMWDCQYDLYNFFLDRFIQGITGGVGK